MAWRYYTMLCSYAIHINDLSKPVYAFWHTALNDPDKLCYRVKNTAVTMEEWHRQRVPYTKTVKLQIYLT